MTEQLDDDARRRRAHGVVDRLHERLLAHDMLGFANQWAPDGTMEFPFAPPGWPRLRSREDVREYLRNYTDMADLQAITHQTRHETTDPDVLIVEWGVDGVALVTGKRYRMDYVAVIRIGEHGIVSYRDYWNSLAAGLFTGRLTDMVDAYESEERQS